MKEQHSRASVWVIAICLIVQVAVAPAAGAQQHEGDRSLVDEAEMDAAVARHLSSEEAARASLRSLLERPAIEAIAERWGLDLQRAQDAVDTLDGDELAEASRHAETIDEALSGGANISIGLVPLLLIIIIIILLA